MKSRIKLLCLCMTLIMMFSVSGCQLAKEEEVSEGEGSKDKFVGLFITTKKVDEKFYAKMTEVEEYGTKVRQYEFEDYEGIPLCQVISSEEGGEIQTELLKNNAVCDLFMSTEAKPDCWSIEGNVYFSEPVGIYINRVFQEEDGDVYVVPDEGPRVLISDGTTGTPSATQDETTVLMNISVIGVPEKIDFVCMGDGNTVIWSNTYEPGKMPKELEIPEGTEYVVVDTAFKSGYDPIREIYAEDDGFMFTFKVGEVNALEQMQTNLNWK